MHRRQLFSLAHRGARRLNDQRVKSGKNKRVRANIHYGRHAGDWMKVAGFRTRRILAMSGNITLPLPAARVCPGGWSPQDPGRHSTGPGSSPVTRPPVRVAARCGGSPAGGRVACLSYEIGIICYH